MNKKIILISISAVLMLVTITFASAINTNNTTKIEKKESPLYKIRTRLATGEKIFDIFKNIKAKFLGERIFFLPFQWFSYGVISIRDRLNYKQTEDPNFCTESVRCTFIFPCTYVSPPCN